MILIDTFYYLTEERTLVGHHNSGSNSFIPLFSTGKILVLNVTPY